MNGLVPDRILELTTQEVETLKHSAFTIETVVHLQGERFDRTVREELLAQACKLRLLAHRATVPEVLLARFRAEGHDV